MTVELAWDDPRIVNLITSVYRTSLGKLGNVERVGISERGALEIQYKPRLSEDKSTMLIMITQKAFMLLNSGKIFYH